MTERFFEIKPRAGDIIKNGGIYAGDGKALMVGRALIHPSRARLAAKFGWKVVPGLSLNGLIEVRKEHA